MDESDIEEFSDYSEVPDNKKDVIEAEPDEKPVGWEEMIDEADTHLQRLEAILEALKSIKSTYPDDPGERPETGHDLPQDLLTSFAEEARLLASRLNGALHEDEVDDQSDDSEATKG